MAGRYFTSLTFELIHNPDGNGTTRTIVEDDSFKVRFFGKDMIEYRRKEGYVKLSFDPHIRERINATARIYNRFFEMAGMRHRVTPPGERGQHHWSISNGEEERQLTGEIDLRPSDRLKQMFPA